MIPHSVCSGTDGRSVFRKSVLANHLAKFALEAMANREEAKAAVREMRRRVQAAGLARPAPRSEIPGTRPVVRAAALSRQADNRAAVAGNLDLCAAPPYPGAGRLCEFRGRRSG